MTSIDRNANALPTGSIIKHRWKIVAKVGQGAFGQTYSALDLENHEHVAIKCEAVTAKKQVLKLEVAILKKLQHLPHFCRFISCGHIKQSISSKEPESATAETTKSYNYIVMQLLGSNLSELRKRRSDAKFSFSTTSLLVKQMISAVEEMHNKGYLHRDIKPSNFAMGLERTLFPDGANRPICFLIDFGLSRRYLSPSGKVREPRDVAGFRGTARYASINAHDCKELGRRDDIWSLFYLAVEFLTGSLPWRKEKDKDVVGKIKKKSTNLQLIQQLPQPIHEFYHHVSNLKYDEKPNYDFLQKLMDDLFDLSGDAKDVAYDWERSEYDDVTESGVSMAMHTSLTAVRAITSTKRAVTIEENFTNNDHHPDLVDEFEEKEVEFLPSTLKLGSTKYQSRSSSGKSSKSPSFNTSNRPNSIDGGSIRHLPNEKSFYRNRPRSVSPVQGCGQVLSTIKTEELNLGHLESIPSEPAPQGMEKENKYLIRPKPPSEAPPLSRPPLSRFRRFRSTRILPGIMNDVQLHETKPIMPMQPTEQLKSSHLLLLTLKKDHEPPLAEERSPVAPSAETNPPKLALTT